MLISAVVGILFEKTPLSEEILVCLADKFPDSAIGDIAKYDYSPIILSVIIAAMAFGLFKLAYFIKARWGSNKNTKQKRDILVHEFYNVAIPQLVEVKSILEQIKGDSSGEERKKTLLLLQAEHEICDLHRRLFNMKIIEKDKDGKQTGDSDTLSSRISKCAYINFLEEMLDVMYEIYKELSENCGNTAEDDISNICATIKSSGVFSQVNEIEEKLQEIKDKIETSASTDMRD